MDMSTIRLGSLCAGTLMIVAGAALASDSPPQLRPRADPWLVKSMADLQAPPLRAAAGELDEVRAAVSRRSPADVERSRWWDVGGPAYRWNQIAVEEMLKEFVATLPATRNLALLHAAIDDSVMAAWAAKQATTRLRPSKLDPSIVTAISVPEGSSYPSDLAPPCAGS